MGLEGVRSSPAFFLQRTLYMVVRGREKVVLAPGCFGGGSSAALFSPKRQDHRSLDASVPKANLQSRPLISI